jgi:hypothetical protein
MSYAGQRAAAARLINAKGGDVVFSRATAATAKDPVTQELPSTPKAATFPMKAVGTPPGTSWRQRSGTLINQNMEELLISPGSYAPQQGDTVLWKRKKWAIRDWMELDPDGSGPLIVRLLIEV